MKKSIAYLSVLIVLLFGTRSFAESTLSIIPFGDGAYTEMTSYYTVNGNYDYAHLAQTRYIPYVKIAAAVAIDLAYNAIAINLSNDVGSETISAADDDYPALHFFYITQGDPKIVHVVYDLLENRVYYSMNTQTETEYSTRVYFYCKNYLNIKTADALSAYLISSAIQQIASGN